MVKQKINGDNNIQISGVQGPVFIDKRRPHFLPNDPNVVDCPYKCGQQTWLNSDKCWNCDRPVAQYFEYQEQLERQRQSNRFSMKVSLVMNIIAMVVGLYLINLSEYVLANAFGSLLSMLGYPILALGTLLNLGLGIKYWLTKDD